MSPNSSNDTKNSNDNPGTVSGVKKQQADHRRDFLGFFIVKKNSKNPETGEPLADPGRLTNPQLEIVYNVANKDSVQFFVIGLIIFNSILMGVATFEFVTDDEDAQETVDVVDEVILSMFTVELIMNIFAYNIIFHKDSWRMFDLMTIVLSLSFSNFKIIRSFRIFRAFRLFGRVPSLNKILSALFNTGEQMMSILFVLVLVFYIFGVMFTQLFSDCVHEPADTTFTPTFLGEFTADLDGVVSNLTTSEINGTVDVDVDMSVEDEDVYYCYGENDPNYWGELHDSFYSLFLLMNLEDWGAMTRQINKRHSWAWFPVISFIFISSFIMLNLVIAVLCDSLAQESENEDGEEDTEEDSEEDREDANKLKENEEFATDWINKISYPIMYKRNEVERETTVRNLGKGIHDISDELTLLKCFLIARKDVPPPSTTSHHSEIMTVEKQVWEECHEFPSPEGFFLHKI